MNWGFSMGKVEQSAMVAVCGVSEEEIAIYGGSLMDLDKDRGLVDLDKQIWV